MRNIMRGFRNHRDIKNVPLSLACGYLFYIGTGSTDESLWLGYLGVAVGLFILSTRDELEEILKILKKIE